MSGIRDEDLAELDRRVSEAIDADSADWGRSKAGLVEVPTAALDALLAAYKEAIARTDSNERVEHE